MTAETSRRLLFDMLRIRSVEETIAARYGEQKMRCPTHLSVGQEAVAAARRRGAAARPIWRSAAIAPTRITSPRAAT